MSSAVARRSWRNGVVQVHVVTADTFGLAQQQLEGLPVTWQVARWRLSDLNLNGPRSKGRAGGRTMKYVWPIIAVSDVPKSAAWYMQLLEAGQTHPGSTVFDQIVDTNGTVLLCLHHWGPSGPRGDHYWSTLTNPPENGLGNGLLLWFVVDDFDATWERAQTLRTPIEENPSTDNGTGMRTFVIQDLDGYHVAVNDARPFDVVE